MTKSQAAPSKTSQSKVEKQQPALQADESSQTQLTELEKLIMGGSLLAQGDALGNPKILTSQRQQMARKFGGELLIEEKKICRPRFQRIIDHATVMRDSRKNDAGKYHGKLNLKLSDLTATGKGIGEIFIPPDPCPVSSTGQPLS